MGVATPKTTNLGLNKVDRSSPTTTTFNTKTLLDDNADILDGKFGISTDGHKHDGTAGNGPKLGSAALADGAVGTAALAAKGVTQAKLADQAVGTTQLAAKAVGSAQLVDGAATDTVIGSRTVSDATAPSGDAGTPTTLFGWLANMIKQITGKASWRTAPAITLETTKAHVDATTGVHGAVSTATANRLIQRDANGRAQVVAPSAAEDIARKDTVDTHANDMIKHITASERTAWQAAADKWGDISSADVMKVISITTNGTDLNTLLTPGNYYCAGTSTAATLLNCPTAVAFSMLVEKHAGVKQTITEYLASGTPRIWYRNLYSGTWSAWKRIMTEYDSATGATANTLVQRDANGRAKVSAPIAVDDIARLDTVSSKVGDLTTLTTTAKTSAVAAINELFQSASDGKTAVAAAITGMGQAATAADTFAQLATKVGNISKDANAGAGDVLVGKTFYQGGGKKSGTIPNYGAGHIVGTQRTAGVLSGDGVNGAYIMPAKGYYDGLTSWAKIPEPDLLSQNWRADKTIFGIQGSIPVKQVNQGVGSGDGSDAESLVFGSASNSAVGRLDVNLPTGYYPGGIGLHIKDLLPWNIRSDVRIGGPNGIQGTMPVKPFINNAVTAVGGGDGNIYLRMLPGAYVNTDVREGSLVWEAKAYDSDFIASNIRSGVNLFGVTGALTSVQMASGSATTNGYRITVNGLAFQPKLIVAFDSSYSNAIYDSRLNATKSRYYSNGLNDWGQVDITLYPDGFSLMVYAMVGVVYHWTAYSW